MEEGARFLSRCSFFFGASLLLCFLVAHASLAVDADLSLFFFFALLSFSKRKEREKGEGHSHFASDPSLGARLRSPTSSSHQPRGTASVPPRRLWS